MKDICPDCGGQGFTVYAVCCRKPQGIECCGQPEPAQEPCQRCETTGYVEQPDPLEGFKGAFDSCLLAQWRGVKL